MHMSRIQNHAYHLFLNTLLAFDVYRELSLPDTWIESLSGFKFCFFQFSVFRRKLFSSDNLILPLISHDRSMFFPCVPSYFFFTSLTDFFFPVNYPVRAACQILTAKITKRRSSNSQVLVASRESVQTLHVSVKTSARRSRFPGGIQERGLNCSYQWYRISSFI